MCELSYIFAAYGGFYACGINYDDVVYVPMPLHHMSGGCLGAGMAVLFGCTIALRKKFSVTNFWSDCVAHNCTVVYNNKTLHVVVCLTIRLPTTRLEMEATSSWLVVEIRFANLGL